MQPSRESLVPIDQQRVIVLDGDPAVRDSLATLLALDEYSVSTYATAAALLRDLDDEDIECVICEADLPDRPGLELYRILRDRHPEARFALLLSRKDPQLLARARELGIQHVFFKPIVHRSLLDFVMRGTSTPR
jgi:FixJ family two-component response regulator